MGVPLESFRAVHRLARQTGRTGNSPPPATLQTAKISGEGYSRVARVFEVFERFGAYRRKSVLHETLVEEFRRANERFGIVKRKDFFPGETFLSRIGLNREIDRLVVRLDKHPEDLAALKNLARASYLRSDRVRLHNVSREILRLDPITQQPLHILAARSGTLAGSRNPFRFWNGACTARAAPW